MRANDTVALSPSAARAGDMRCPDIPARAAQLIPLLDLSEEQKRKELAGDPITAICFVLELLLIPMIFPF